MTEGTSTKPRYDPVAEWYQEYTTGWDPSWLLDLVGDVDGQRVLDIGCGTGIASRELARRGARVTGVDISSEMVRLASATEAAEPLGIEYLVHDVAAHRPDGEAFDGVVASMVLMDVDDLDGVLGSAVQSLMPAGWFLASLAHPCFPGNDNRISSWPPELGYFAEGYWNTGSEGVRGHVGAHHRTLATYVNAIADAGLAITRLAEPNAGDLGLPFLLAIRATRR